MDSKFNPVFFPDKCHHVARFCFFCYYVACVITAASWIREIFTGESLAQHLIPWLSCPVILRAAAVKEAIKAIGISSALMVWLINSVDKRAFGLIYSEIIHECYPYYWTCSIIHVIFTLGGIISGAAGASESTLFSLGIILFGLLIQWHVLYNLILNHSIRENRASEILKKRLNIATSTDTIYEIQQKMARTPIQDCGNPQLLQKRLAESLVLYAQKDTSTIRIPQLSDTWAILLQGKEKGSKAPIIGSIISACIQTKHGNPEERKQALTAISAGLLVCMVRQSFDKKNSPSSEEKMSDIATEIRRTMYQNSGCNLPEYQELADYTFRCLCTLFTVIVLVAYFRNGLKLNDELMSMRVFTTEREWEESAIETVRTLFPIVDDCREQKLISIAKRAFALTEGNQYTEKEGAENEREGYSAEKAVAAGR